MSFGWSAGDLLQFAKLAFEVYEFVHNAPEEIQVVIQKYEDVGQKLQRLSKILDNSRLGVWNGAPKLRKHLEEANEYLNQFRPMASRTASPQLRAKKTVIMAIDRSKIKRINDHLKIYEEQMNSFENDLVLACTLWNAEQVETMMVRANMPVAQDWYTHVQSISGPSTQQLLPAPQVEESDSVSVASSAVIAKSVRALTMARKLRRERPLRVITESPPIIAESSPQDRQRINNFIEDVVELAETKNLYARDADLVENIDTLAEIAEKAAALNSTLIRSKAGMSAEVAAYHLPPMGDLTPQSLAQDVFQHLSLSDSASTSQWAANQSHSSTEKNPPSPHLRPGMIPPTPAASTSDRTRSDHSRSVLASAEEEPGEIFDMETSSSTEEAPITDVGPAAKEHLDLPGWIKLDLGGPRPVTCQLDLETQDASIRIWAVATNQRRQGSTTFSPSTPTAATPSMLLSGKQPQEHAEAPSQPRTFQHCFQIGARPIPHFLHPDLEGSENEPTAPYSLSFKERQYVSEEGAADGLRWSTTLKYIFANEDGRNTLSEKIFGKTRITTVGANRINVNGTIYSHMAAITLWLDDASGIKSMTFFRDLTSGRNTSKILEYQVLGLEDAKKASKSGNGFTVMVQAMNPTDTDPTSPSSPRSTFSRPSSVLTSMTGNTTSTARSRAKQKSEVVRCTIDFSSLDFKRSFMKHARHQYSPV